MVSYFHRNKERRILHQVVEKAHACNDFLTEIVDFALAYVAKDLTIVIGKLCTALKVLVTVPLDAFVCQLFYTSLFAFRFYGHRQAFSSSSFVP